MSLNIPWICGWIDWWPTRVVAELALHCFCHSRGWNCMDVVTIEL